MSKMSHAELFPARLFLPASLTHPHEQQNFLIRNSYTFVVLNRRYGVESEHDLLDKDIVSDADLKSKGAHMLLEVQSPLVFFIFSHLFPIHRSLSLSAIGMTDEEVARFRGPPKHESVDHADLSTDHIAPARVKKIAKVRQRGISSKRLQPPPIKTPFPHAIFVCFSNSLSLSR